MRDTGLLHALPGASRDYLLLGDLRVGSSFEGFTVKQRTSGLPRYDVYRRATHACAEFDLLVLRGGRRYRSERRFTDAPAYH